MTLELIHWLDHSGPWDTADEADLIPRETVGWVLLEGPLDVLRVAGTRDTNGYTDITAIAKQLIMSRTVLDLGEVKRR